MTRSIEDNRVLARWLSYGYTILVIASIIATGIEAYSGGFGSYSIPVAMLGIAAIAYANANQFMAEADRLEREADLSDLDAELAGLEARVSELEKRLEQYQYVNTHEGAQS